MSDTWQEIIHSYTPEKRDWERRYPYLYYIVRPLSLRVSYLAVAMGVGANGVTHLTVVTASAACVLFAIGGPVAFLGAAGLMVLTNLLDCVDGNLARMRPAHPAGAFLDAVASHPYYWAYFFLGVGLFRQGPAGGWVEPWCLLALGAWASIARLSSFLCGSNAELLNLRLSALGREPPRSGVTRAPAYTLFRNLVELNAHDILLVPAALTGALDLFLALSAGALTVETAAVHLFLYSRAARQIPS